MTQRAVGRREGAAFLGVSQRTFDAYRKSAKAQFPKPFLLPAERRAMPRWWLSDLEAWALSRPKGE